MKNNRAFRKDGISTEMLKYGEKMVFNNWNESIIMILHKTGNRTDLKNYQPIM